MIMMNAGQKLVSIVVPVYNAEKYLTNCVQALQRQTYKNIEILLVDDGSEDKSLQICQRFAEADSRICAIHKENGGVSSARNRGIIEASGYYLMFADSDDLPDPEWVRHMVKLAEQWNINFVICTYRKANNYIEAKQPIDHKKAFEPVWALTREEFFEVLGYMMTFRETMFAPWNKLFVLDVVKEHQIAFPEDLSYGEDFLFNLAYAEYCSGVIETREQLYNYIEQNPESLEARYKPDLFENQTRIYQAVKQFMIAHNAYGGFNVSSLSYFYANKALLSILNQFHEKNGKAQIQIRNYVEQIVRSQDVIESVLLADLHEKPEQDLLTSLIKAKQYDKIYDAFEDLLFEKEAPISTIRYQGIPNPPCRWGWIPYIIHCFQKYGIVITLKRMVRKLKRRCKR